MPLALSDAELRIVMTAAGPIRVRERDQFLRDVSSSTRRLMTV
jgi:hypothetical protein